MEPCHVNSKVNEIVETKSFGKTKNIYGKIIKNKLTSKNHNWLFPIWKKNKCTFRLENASKLTHEFCMTIFTRKFSLLKLSKEGKRVYIFFLQMEAFNKRKYENYSTRNLIKQIWLGKKSFL